MGYVAFLHILVLKNNLRLEYEEIPEDLQTKLQDLEFDKYSDEDLFCDLLDYHYGSIDRNLLEISKLYPDYVFVIREFQVEHNIVRFAFIWNGKRVDQMIEIVTPTVTQEDFDKID